MTFSSGTCVEIDSSHQVMIVHRLEISGFSPMRVVGAVLVGASLKDVAEGKNTRGPYLLVTLVRHWP